MSGYDWATSQEEEYLRFIHALQIAHARAILFVVSDDAAWLRAYISLLCSIHSRPCVWIDLSQESSVPAAIAEVTRRTSPNGVVVVSGLDSPVLYSDPSRMSEVVRQLAGMLWLRDIEPPLVFLLSPEALDYLAKEAAEFYVQNSGIFVLHSPVERKEDT